MINQSVHTLDLLAYFLGTPLAVEAGIQNHHLKGIIEVEDTMELISVSRTAPPVFMLPRPIVTMCRL